MAQWTREITQALGINERHSEPGLATALAASLAILLQAPFTMVHAGDALFQATGRYVLSYAFLLAMAVFAGIVSFRKPDSYLYFRKPVCAVTWSLLTALIAGALPALHHFGMANEVVLAICGMVFGVGLTCLLFFLAHLFTRTYIPDILKRAFAGAAVAVLLEAAVMTRVPGEAALAICAVLLVADIPLMMLLLKNAPAVGDYQHFKSFAERRGDTRLFLAKVALPVACTGIVVRLFFAQGEHAATALPEPGLLSDLNLLVLILVAYVITCFAIYGVRSFGWPFAQFFSFLIPLVCLLGCVSVSSSVAGQGDFDGGTMVMLCLILALTWSFMGGASLEYLLRSASVFGLGLASLALGILVGDLMVHVGLLGTPGGSIVLSLVCLVMAIGYLPARPAPNLSLSTYDTPLRSACTPEEGEDEEPEGAEAEEPARTAPASQTAPEAEEPAHAPVKGRFMRRCDAVAKMFLLSARETEVLYLLAKGRSMNHIMEELVISEGTTKTHINHVYKKLGVHSRHELLDLIESIEVETLDLN
jgi:DNA-binding CsgD family transcriptional regulator